MIKLVNSPCVIKCKVHANYDSVQSVSVLVRARGVGGVAVDWRLVGGGVGCCCWWWWLVVVVVGGWWWW